MKFDQPPQKENPEISEKKISALVEKCHLINFRNSYIPNELYEIAASEKDKLKNFFQKNMALSSVDGFYKNKRLIEILAHLSCAFYRERYLYQGENVFFSEILKGVSQEKESIYINNLFAKAMLEKSKYMVENYYNPSAQYDYFEITHDVFARTDGEKIKISKKENYFAINEKLKKLEQTKQKLLFGKKFDRNKNIHKLVKTDYEIFQKEINDDIDLPGNNYELKKVFPSIVDPKVSEVIQKELGFNTRDLSINEQFYFLDYISTVKMQQITVAKYFIEKYNINGLRTFLSVEQGGREMGDKILTLGEKLPEDIAMKIFEKYGEIIDNVNKILEFTQHNFTQEINTNPELIKKIEETLYIKGKNLLSETYDNLMKETDIDCPDLERKLERINVDTITTFAIFKQAVKNGEKLPIESIDGSIFSKKKANEISKEQQNEMLELYDDNWKNHPDRDFVESLKEYFKTAFTPTENQEKNYLYTFEKDNKIRAFVRFEKQNGGLYASALNVDDASKNFGLGEAMMDESLAREAKNNILHASCRKDNHSNMRYFEKGFISRGFKKTNNTEEFDLVWDEGKNKNILAKQKTQEELKNMFGKENQDDLEIRKAKELVSLNTEIPEGKALVRCFFDQQSKEWYAIYEKVEDDYGVNFGEAR